MAKARGAPNVNEGEVDFRDRQGRSSLTKDGVTIIDARSLASWNKRAEREFVKNDMIANTITFYLTNESTNNSSRTLFSTCTKFNNIISMKERTL